MTSPARSLGFALLVASLPLLGSGPAPQVVRALAKHRDPSLGMEVVKGEILLPAARPWPVVVPAPGEQGISQIQLVPPPSAGLTARALREQETEIRQQAESAGSRLSADFTLRQAFSRYAKAHEGLGPTSLEEPAWLQAVAQGMDSKVPPLPPYAPESSQQQRVESMRNSLEGFSLLPRVALASPLFKAPSPQKAGQPLLIEVAPTLADGLHWVVDNTFRPERRKVDSAFLAQHGLKLSQHRVTQLPRLLDPLKPQPFGLLGLRRGQAREVRLHLLKPPGAPVELRWKFDKAPEGGKDLLSQWALRRAAGWQQGTGEVSPLVPHFQAMQARVYGVKGSAPSPEARNPQTQGPSFLSLFGGRTAVEETLQLDRALAPRTAQAPSSNRVPIAEIPGVAVASHPWKTMLPARTPQAPAILDCVPLDRGLLYLPRPREVLDEFSSGGARFLSRVNALARQGALDHDLIARAQADLGLGGGLGRRLLEAGAIHEAAVFVPDLALLSGSDLTLILEVAPSAVPLLAFVAGETPKSVPTPRGEAWWARFGTRFFASTSRVELELALALHRVGGTEPVPKPPRAALGAPGGPPQERRDEHSGSTRFEPDAVGDRPPPQPGGTTPGGRSAASAPLTHEPHGPAVTSLRSIPPDVVAAHGGFGTGSTGSLGRSDEFQVMLGKLAPTADTRAFVYFSDAFIRQLVGPARRILHLRRDRARGLMEELAAAVELRRLDAPDASTAPSALQRLGYLREGFPVSDFTVAPDGTVASPQWGPLARMRPGGVEPTEAEPWEAEAYGAFREGYTRYWQRFFDPIAMRLESRADGSYHLETFILPLLDHSAYRELKRWISAAPPQATQPAPLWGQPMVAELAFDVPWGKVGTQVAGRRAGAFGVPLPPELFEGLEPRLHVAFFDAAPVVQMGGGSPFDLMEVGGRGGGDRLLFLAPLLLGPLTRPMAMAVPLKDPEATNALLAQLTTSDFLIRRSREFEWRTHQGADGRTQISLSFFGAVTIRWSLRVEGSWLIASNDTSLPSRLLAGTEQRPGAHGSLAFRPSDLKLGLSAAWQAFVESEALSDWHAQRWLAPWLSAGISLPEAQQSSRHIFGAAPTLVGDLSPGPWPVNQRFGSPYRPLLPALPEGKDFGLFEGVHGAALDLTFEEDGLRTRVHWTPMVPPK